MADLDSLVSTAKDAISALISKPKMAEKLLAKPPFRFLHDIISAITQTTGFAEGLYSGPELDSAGITDKNAKIDYLEKIFNFVGICKGTTLDIRALKVVAGLEPENTNMFLIALAEVASDPAYDTASALQRHQAGEVAGSGPPAKKVKSIFSMYFYSHPNFTTIMLQASRRADSKDSAPEKSSVKSSVDDPKLEAASLNEANPDRGKSRGGTRGGKPPSQAQDVGLATPALNLDHHLEACDGSFALTQTLLGELITKPRLSDKLLSKPPFRFLYDIIMEVCRATGFAAGLFTAEEWDPAAVAEKNQKLLYLEKIIKLVGIQLNTIVETRPAKIISGLDAEDTNRFLQFLAVTAKHAPESRASVRMVLDQMGLPANDAPVAAAAVAPAAAAVPPMQPSVAPMKAEEKASVQPSKAEPERKEIAPAASEDQEDESDSKRSSRPTTARRRPPKVKEDAHEVGKKDAVVPQKAQGIMVDGANDDEDEEIPEVRLADDVAESKSVGDPQSKLVRDILGRQAEQDADRNAPVVEQEEAKGDETGKGGIRLNRLRKGSATNDKKSVTASTGNAQLGEVELGRLRAAIQTLVLHTGPLGSCLDFLQEDVSIMTGELRRWEEEARKFEVKVDAETTKSDEGLHTLQAELGSIDDQVGTPYPIPTYTPLPPPHSIHDHIKLTPIPLPPLHTLPQLNKICTMN